MIELPSAPERLVAMNRARPGSLSSRGARAAGLLVWCLAFAAPAQTAQWSPPSSAKNLWSLGANWSTGAMPDTNTTAWVMSSIPCVIDATAGVATCSHLSVADGAGSSGTVIVTNGGVFAPCTDWCAVGYSGHGTFVTASNSTTTFPSHLWIALQTGSTGSLIMNGGTVTVLGMFGEGWSGGVGTARINGGTLYLSQLHPSQSLGPGSVLDISQGKVIISGNSTAAVRGYIAAGKITAYGGSGTVIVDYNNLNPGKTTVYALNASLSSWPRVFIPTLNTNEVVIAAATPQLFGAKGDGATDDSAAFQSAIDTIVNTGGAGGGVLFVPAATYAFYTNLTIPDGVTLHGDWQDWTKGTNGLAGTTFKVCYGAGQTNAAPFIFLNGSTALKGLNLWYPDQDPAGIVGYPFAIGLSGDCVVENVVLVNAYQGIQVAPPTSGAKHILSTVIGTPLYLGIDLDMIADISHLEDIRFSPEVWPASRLTNAPTAGGPHAPWMRANGEGLRLRRVDGEVCVEVNLSGYRVGIESNSSANGSPGATFYSSSITNCGIALLAQEMPFQSGLQFARCNLDGDVAVSHTSNEVATLQFYDCQLTGHSGVAVVFQGPANNWVSWAQFQDCTVTGTLQLNSGVFNVVNSTLNVAAGSNHCVLGVNANRAAFTGCDFFPAKAIANLGSASRLLVDGRRPLAYPLPDLRWTNVVNDYLARRPARTNLYVVTQAPWSAAGTGAADDTLAIQSALTTAGNHGGGVVYLPPGKYHLTNTLDVPGGVELRGPYELRHRTWPGADGVAKGAVLQPYGGQGTSNGPPAIALEAGGGLVGLTISYETQNSNCIVFPATIQGRGANVYAIGVVCPNPYYYVDLDTWTCTNHLLYMVDGWALSKGYRVGNGSSGSIVDCHGNFTYWWDNYDSQSVLSTSGGARAAVQNFAEHQLEMYFLGDCTELMVKDFVIPSRIFLHCGSENGRGPNLTGIGTMCDATGEAFRLDAATANLSTVNSTLAVFADYPDLTNTTVGVLSSNFQGTARFFNTALFGGPYWDLVIGGGEVDFAQIHMLDHSYRGSRVDSGVMQLVNLNAYISYNGPSSDVFPIYKVAFGAGAGLTGKVCELVAAYALNGCSDANANPGNPVLAWANYNLATPLSAAANLSVTVPPISIRLQPGATNATLAWPGTNGAFLLYSAPNLTPPIPWTLETSTPGFSNTLWSLSQPVTLASNRFYRLQH